MDMGMAMVLLFLDGITLQQGGIFDFLTGGQGLGSDDPVITNMIVAVFAVAGFGILVGVINAIVRKKMTDAAKMQRILNETRAYNKEMKLAYKSKDQDKINKLNRKRAYISRLSMEMMQMNMRPMIITIVPFMLLILVVLPFLFSYTVAISPVSLNVIPGDYFVMTCTAEQAADNEHVCVRENEIFLISWYMLAAMAFSGMIIKVTKTDWGIGT